MSAVARWRNTAPAGVSPSGRTLRSNNTVLVRSSISAIAWETAGCVSPMTRAAAAMVP